jgi:translocation and assembly module TamB
LPGAGITLSNGSLQLTLANAGDVRVQGQVTSGAGSVRLTGSGGLDAASVLSARIEGSDFTLMDVPGARVVVAPALTLTRDRDGYHLSGEVGIPTARIDAEHLPGGKSTQRSADVVVVDRPAAAPGTDAMPLDAEVAVVLGKDVKLTGYGLDGSVSGRLTVHDRPGRIATGRGSVSIEGSYQAYGQKLAIERGRLLFAGTALDDPGLDLRAARSIGDIKAGVAVSGRASAPVLNVYSTPAMAQSEALSYLMTGRPLNGLKGSEGAMVNNAARAMGTAAGNRLAQSVGAKVGIDAGVSENAVLGGAAFTVGKYLSPKLFVSYGVGLFTPGEIVTLRYLLTKRWNIEIENASRASRTGVNYRLERQ